MSEQAKRLREIADEFFLKSPNMHLSEGKFLRSLADQLERRLTDEMIEKEALWYEAPQTFKEGVYWARDFYEAKAQSKT